MGFSVATYRGWPDGILERIFVDMSHIDSCLNTLRRLIAEGDPSAIALAETAIEEYWVATPVRARKSGLLYIQQILHDRRETLGGESRVFADALDGYFERKLAGPVD
jgi:hypothetical protein